MLETHVVSDFCLIGPKGCGKSITVQTLANLMGYQVEPVVLYQASFIFNFNFSNFNTFPLLILVQTNYSTRENNSLIEIVKISFQDMTSRDLIQQRTTLSNGDTIWKNSPLVEAALHGKLAVLDGINRTDPSTLAVLHRYR